MSFRQDRSGLRAGSKIERGTVLVRVEGNGWGHDSCLCNLGETEEGSMTEGVVELERTSAWCDVLVEDSKFDENDGRTT